MAELRGIGMEAERTMLAATGGVNTHRAAIFGLGLLCAAAGAVWAGLAPRGRDSSYVPSMLGAVVRQRWGRANRARPRSPAQPRHVTKVVELGPGNALARIMRVAMPGNNIHSLSEFHSLEGLKHWLIPTALFADRLTTVSVEGTAYEVEPQLAGETVTLLWGLFDQDLFVEHGGPGSGSDPRTHRPDARRRRALVTAVPHWGGA